jgi:hypothetical protein
MVRANWVKEDSEVLAIVIFTGKEGASGSWEDFRGYFALNSSFECLLVSTRVLRGCVLAASSQHLNS